MLSKFYFWIRHVVLINDVLCGSFCPTCKFYRFCKADISGDDYKKITGKRGTKNESKC